MNHPTLTLAAAIVAAGLIGFGSPLAANAMGSMHEGHHHMHFVRLHHHHYSCEYRYHGHYYHRRHCGPVMGYRHRHYNMGY